MAAGFAMQAGDMEMVALGVGLWHGLYKGCSLCFPWLFSVLPLLFEPSSMSPLSG